MARNSYTMWIRGLPNYVQYILSPWASGVHIRKTTCAHGITITCMYVCMYNIHTYVAVYVCILYIAYFHKYD